MQSEQFPSEARETGERIFPARELQVLKMDLQREVITLFCAHEQCGEEEVMGWIEKHSDTFREIFEKKIKEEGNGFFQRAKSNPREVAQEFFLALRDILTEY